MELRRICIIGVGNIGSAIARGLVEYGKLKPENITLTRRRIAVMEDFRKQGFNIVSGNAAAIKDAHLVILAMRPRQVNAVLHELKPALDSGQHRLISVVSSISIAEIKNIVGVDMEVIRAMPNTAIAIGQSMTCLATQENDGEFLDEARTIFDSVGKTHVIHEEQMVPATALAACGVAFFLRAIRASSQGGIEIGFHSEDAIKIAAQTAKGAACLLLDQDSHPESEIDKVTTPRGCTIAGLNRMEHEGLSSALIKGIVTSAEKASALYVANNGVKEVVS